MKTVVLGILTPIKQFAVAIRKSVKETGKILKKYGIDNREFLLYREIEAINKHESLKLNLEMNIKCKLLYETIEFKKEFQDRRFTIGFVGHIGHGKTTLITRIIDRDIKEFHDITQNANLYNIENIDIVDTPGHNFFSYIRQNIIEIVDIVFLVIDLDDGVKFETENILKYIKVNDFIHKTICIFNKSDKCKDLTKSCNNLRKDIASRLNILETEVEYIVLNQSMDVKSKINGILEMYELPESKEKITVIANDMNSILLRVNYESIEDTGYILIQDREYKIKSININNLKVRKVESRRVCRVVLEDGLSSNIKTAVYTSSVSHMESYKTYSYFLENMNKPEPKKEADAEVAKSILIIAPDFNLIQNIKERIGSENVKITGAFTTLTSNNIKVLDRNNEVIIFNSEISPEIKKELDSRSIKHSSYTNIYHLIDYIDKMCSKYGYPSSSKNVAEIIKIFKLKDAIILGCHVIIGKFSMGDTAQTMGENEELLPIQFITLKTDSNLIKQANRGDKFGAFIKGAIHKMKEGMFIYN